MISMVGLELDDPDFKKKKKELDKGWKPYRINHLSWWKEELPSGGNGRTNEFAEAWKRGGFYCDTLCIFQHSSVVESGNVSTRFTDGLFGRNTADSEI